MQSLPYQLTSLSSIVVVRIVVAIDGDARAEFLFLDLALWHDICLGFPHCLLGKTHLAPHLARLLEGLLVLDGRILPLELRHSVLVIQLISSLGLVHGNSLECRLCAARRG